MREIISVFRHDVLVVRLSLMRKIIIISVFSHDVLLKEQLAARGFVSDVTVKRREEALLVRTIIKNGYLELLVIWVCQFGLNMKKI